MYSKTRHLCCITKPSLSLYFVDRDLAGIEKLNEQHKTAARYSGPIRHKVATVFPKIARDAHLFNKGLGSCAVEVPAEFIKDKRLACSRESFHDLIATA